MSAGSEHCCISKLYGETLWCT